MRFENPQPEAAPEPPAPAEARHAIFDHPPATHRLSSRHLTLSDRTYRLFVAEPVAAPPSQGFPILYALDGNAVFDLLTPDMLAAVPGLFVVGVGHDTKLRFDPPMRSLDYTPSPGGNGPRSDPQRPERMIGGADAMLERVCGALRNAAEGDLPVDPTRRTIFGHSLAGLFVIYALLTRPEAFSQFMAASPSIWWGDEFLLAVEARTKTPAPEERRVFITLGDSEKRSSPSGPHWDGPAPHTLEMVRRLGNRRNFSVASHVLKDHGHAATLPASLPLALRFAATGMFPQDASRRDAPSEDRNAWSATVSSRK